MSSMELGLKKITKPLRATLSFLKRKVFVIDPDRNWHFIVLIFIIVVFAIALSKFFLFYKISSDDFIYDNDERDVSIETIDRGALNNVLSEYKLKSDRFESLKNNPPSIPAP